MMQNAGKTFLKIFLKVKNMITGMKKSKRRSGGERQRHLPNNQTKRQRDGKSEIKGKRLKKIK